MIGDLVLYISSDIFACLSFGRAGLVPLVPATASLEAACCGRADQASRLSPLAVYRRFSRRLAPPRIQALRLAPGRPVRAPFGARLVARSLGLFLAEGKARFVRPE